MAILLAFIVLCAGLTALAWHNATETPADDVSRAVLQDTGLNVRFGKAAAFALWPRPRVRIEGVELLSQTGELLLRAEGAEAQLALLPLLIGAAQVDEIRLRDVTVTMPAMTGGELFGMLDRAAALPRAHSRKVRILNGTLAHPGGAQPWTGITATITTPDASQPLTFAGSANWKGETITFSGAMPASSLFSTGSAPAWLAVQTRHGRLDLTGAMAEPASPRFAGEMHLSTSSLKSFADWSGLAAPFADGVGAFKLSSDVAWSARRTSLDQAQISLNGQRFEGALSLQFDGSRPALSGTLATSGTVDLAPFLPDAATVRQGGQWSRAPFDWRRLQDADLDLRLSAGTAQAGRLAVEQAAIALFLKNGRLEATLGRAGLAKGTIKGRLTLQPHDDEIDAKLQGTLDGVQPELLLPAFGRPASIGGNLQGQISLEANGRNPADIAATLQGRLSGTVRSGELTFVDLAETLRSVDKSTPITQFVWQPGRTEFDQISFSTVVSDGLVRLVDGILASPSLRATATGEAVLASGQISGRVAVGSAAAGARAPLAADVAGFVDAPSVRPDVRSLIERARPAPPGQPG